MTLEQLGPYRIGRQLGRGGMGTVYEGMNGASGQPAAVKVLNPRLAVDDGFRERFATEIETLKKLKHPNIVRLYGFGEEAGHLYYAMELVEGDNLEDELQAGRRYNWRETTQLGVKLAKALKHAHDHGVIHRDLKPANLLLPADGDVKLADFGIARLFGNTRLTTDGGLIGTAEYMAPEQADGRPVTFHCDLYSLGCVLFAMLAGRPPFRGGSLPEMLQFHRFAEPPPVSKYADDVPDELQRIIARLLSKDPATRGTNALIVARQLSAMEHALSLRPPKYAEQPPLDLEPPEPAPLSPIPLADAATQIDVGQAFEPDSRAGKPDQRTQIPDPLATLASAPHSPAKPSQRLPADGAAQADLRLTATPMAGGESLLVDLHHTPSGTPTPPAAVSRFTTVEEDEQRRADAERQSQRRGAWIQIGLLAASLAVVIALGVYLTRPLSADALYDRIETVAGDESPARLVDAEDDIRKFLKKFPDDPRRPKLVGYLEEVDLARLERRLQRAPRQVGHEKSLLPIERDYLEAMSHQATAPEETIARLKAILDVYQPLPNPAPTGQFLELTRRQLARLEEQTSKSVPEYLAVIDASLKRADQIERDDPAAAQSIRAGLITLYGDKPWAAEKIALARTALNRNTATTAGNPK